MWDGEAQLLADLCVRSCCTGKSEAVEGLRFDRCVAVRGRRRRRRWDGWLEAVGGGHGSILENIWVCKRKARAYFDKLIGCLVGTMKHSEVDILAGDIPVADTVCDAQMSVGGLQAL